MSRKVYHAILAGVYQPEGRTVLDPYPIQNKNGIICSEKRKPLPAGNWKGLECQRVKGGRV
jgi:hypothetical protein